MRAAVWIPIHCVSFSGMVPVHLRVHFVAVMSFFTLMATSVLQGKLEKQRECLSEGGGVSTP